MDDLVTSTGMSVSTTEGALRTLDVSAMLESFISYLDASPASVRTYARAIRPFMKFVQENNITAPARKDVIRFRDVLLETRKASTVQLYMTAVRLFFQWAEDTGMYQDITRRVRVSKPNQGMHAKDCLTMNQCIDVLLAARKQESFMKGTRDFAMIYLMLAGGFRTIEISRANVEDLRQRGEHCVLYVQGKGREDKREFVRVSPEAAQAVREYLRVRGAKEGEPLFTACGNRKGEQGRMSTRSVSKVVKGAMRAAGYDSERLTAHSTRHTAVTMALSRGEPLEKVQQFARHKNIQTTLIYVHELSQDSNDCSDRVGSAIAEALRSRAA